MSWKPDLQMAAFLGSRVVVWGALAATAINDKWSLGRVHPVSLWVPLFLVLWESVLVPFVTGTHQWRELALRLYL